jgi:biotin synthase
MDLEKLHSRMISGEPISPDTARELWDAEFWELLHFADKIARYFKGNKVNLCSIVNAKSGHCSEDCRFCAQSSHNNTGITPYPLMGMHLIEETFRKASASSASCFGIVTSGEKIGAAEIDIICSYAKRLKKEEITLSVSLGELDERTLEKLKQAGVKKVHNNLETAESFFDKVCTTHTFADRLANVKRAKKAGFKVCSGALFGMGESREQRAELAFVLRDLEVDSVPLNFLNPIPGTPFEHLAPLSCREILRTISVIRFILPKTDISVCGGREANLRDLQSLIFYAGANGMMVGGYLTTSSRDPELDLRMIRDLGLEVNNDK